MDYRTSESDLHTHSIYYDRAMENARITIAEELHVIIKKAKLVAIFIKVRR